MIVTSEKYYNKNFEFINKENEIEQKMGKISNIVWWRYFSECVSFWKGRFNTPVFNDCLYNLGLIYNWYSDIIPWENLRPILPYILKEGNRIGTFDFYYNILKALFGEQAVIRFDEINQPNTKIYFEMEMRNTIDNPTIGFSSGSGDRFVQVFKDDKGFKIAYYDAEKASPLSITKLEKDDLCVNSNNMWWYILYSERLRKVICVPRTANYGFTFDPLSQKIEWFGEACHATNNEDWQANYVSGDNEVFTYCQWSNDKTKIILGTNNENGDWHIYSDYIAYTLDPVLLDYKGYFPVDTDPNIMRANFMSGTSGYNRDTFFLGVHNGYLWNCDLIRNKIYKIDTIGTVYMNKAMILETPNYIELHNIYNHDTDYKNKNYIQRYYLKLGKSGFTILTKETGYEYDVCDLWWDSKTNVVRFSNRIISGIVRRDGEVFEEGTYEPAQKLYFREDYYKMYPKGLTSPLVKEYLESDPAIKEDHKVYAVDYDEEIAMVTQSDEAWVVEDFDEEMRKYTEAKQVEYVADDANGNIYEVVLSKKIEENDTLLYVQKDTETEKEKAKVYNMSDIEIETVKLNYTHWVNQDPKALEEYKQTLGAYSHQSHEMVQTKEGEDLHTYWIYEPDIKEYVEKPIDEILDPEWQKLGEEPDLYFTREIEFPRYFDLENPGIMFLSANGTLYKIGYWYIKDRHCKEGITYIYVSNVDVHYALWKTKNIEEDKTVLWNEDAYLAFSRAFSLNISVSKIENFLNHITPAGYLVKLFVSSDLYNSEEETTTTVETTTTETTTTTTTTTTTA